MTKVATIKTNIFQGSIKYPDLSVELVMITPEIAEAWLDKNINNRRILPRYLKLYTRDMKKNAWMLTGETIIFSWDGNLLNGQTRLKACVASGCSFPSLVVYGIDPRAQMAMDSGKARTGADVLAFLGIDKQRAALVVPIARLIHQVKNDGAMYGGRSSMSQSELKDVTDRHPALVEYVVQRKGPRGMPWPALGFLNYVGSKLMDRKHEAMMMIEVIQTGNPSRPGCPIHAFRERAMNLGVRTDTRQNITWTLFHAWNLFLAGEQVSKMAVKSTKVDIEGLDLDLL